MSVVSLDCVMQLVSGASGRPKELVMHGSMPGPTSAWLELHIADGVTALEIPGVGSGDAQADTLTCFGLLAYGTIFLTWNAGSTLLAGTASAPAAFMVFNSVTGATPTLTNSSGDTVTVHLIFAGA
jgi:hypothetical protein